MQWCCQISQTPGCRSGEVGGAPGSGGFAVGKRRRGPSLPGGYRSLGPWTWELPPAGRSTCRQEKGDLRCMSCWWHPMKILQLIIEIERVKETEREKTRGFDSPVIVDVCRRHWVAKIWSHLSTRVSMKLANESLIVKRLQHHQDSVLFSDNAKHFRLSSCLTSKKEKGPERKHEELMRFTGSAQFAAASVPGQLRFLNFLSWTSVQRNTGSVGAVWITGA